MNSRLKEIIRQAGGIVHSDGNIFFTTADQFSSAASALPAVEAVTGPSDAEILDAAIAFPAQSAAGWMVGFARAVLARFGSPPVAAPADLTQKEHGSLLTEDSALNDWFLTLSEGRQQALLDGGRWMLADAAFEAGRAGAAAPTPAAATTDGAAEVAAFPEAYLGQLATVNQDDYPGLAAWWLQIRDGSADGAVIARVYGESPDDVYKRAQAICACISAPSQAHGNSEAVAK